MYKNFMKLTTYSFFAKINAPEHQNKLPLSLLYDHSTGP